MPKAVERVAISVDRVNTVNIVDVTIPVIIKAVPGNFPGIHPHVVHQIRVVVIHPGADNYRHHIRVPGGEVPGFGRLDHRPGPLVRILGVIGNGIQVAPAVGFGVGHARILLIPRDGLLHG